MRLDIVNHTICLFIDWSAIYVHKENSTSTQYGKAMWEENECNKKKFKKNCYILWSGLVEAVRIWCDVGETSHWVN